MTERPELSSPASSAIARLLAALGRGESVRATGLRGGARGEVLAQATAQVAHAGGIDIAALGDLGGQGHRLGQSAFQHADLFERGGLGLGIEAGGASGGGRGLFFDADDGQVGNAHAEPSGVLCARERWMA